MYMIYMYAYSLRFNRQLILCVAVRQKLGGKHAASGESRRPRQQACARSIRETRSSLVSRELFSLHSGAARTAVRQACPSGHRCRQVSRGERTRESGIYSAWRQNDSNHAHSVSDADALVALWQSRLAHESSRSRATSVAKREQSRCAAMPQWKWTSSFCRRPAPNSSHAAPAYRNRARSAMLRLHLSHKATGEIKLNRQARSHVLRVS